MPSQFLGKNEAHRTEIIVNDLIDLAKKNEFNMHKKEDYDFDTSRSFLK